MTPLMYKVDFGQKGYAMNRDKQVWRYTEDVVALNLQSYKPKTAIEAGAKCKQQLWGLATQTCRVYN